MRADLRRIRGEKKKNRNAREGKQVDGVGNAAVLMGLSIPKPSRDHPEGLTQAFGPSPERVGEANSPSAPFLCPSCPFFSSFQPYI